MEDNSKSKLMLEPFLKWAGGKRWIVNRHPEIFPLVFGRYVEPFVGSGAVFFYLKPHRAVLSDSNADLVNAYQVLRSHPDKVHRLLLSYQSGIRHRFIIVGENEFPKVLSNEPHGSCI